MATAEGPTFGDRLAALGVAVGVAFAGGLAAAVSGGFFAVILGPVGDSLAGFAFTYVGAYAMLGLAAAAYVLSRGVEFLDLDPPTLVDVRDVLVAYLAVVALALLVAGGASLADVPVVHAASLGNPVAPSLLLAAFPLTLAVGAPAQELLFRNVCQKRIAEVAPTWFAVGASSLLMVAFALATFAGAPPVGLVVPALVVAVASSAIGLVYARSGNLVAAWLLHCALTASLLSVLYLDATTALELSALG